MELNRTLALRLLRREDWSTVPRRREARGDALRRRRSARRSARSSSRTTP
jgi:hypothetical protein